MKGIARTLGVPVPMEAAVWMVCAGTSYVMSGALTRILGDTYSTFELVFLRCVVAVAFLAPYFSRIGISALRTAQLRLHLGRSLLTYAGLLLWFFAVSKIPIADYYALQFMLPIFTISGAVIFLGERAGPRTWLATLAGFFGALVILRPGFQEVGWGAMAAVGAALAYACVNLCVRVLGRTESAAVIVTYANSLVLILALGPAVYVWKTPDLAHVPIIVGIGVLSTFGQIGLTRAIALADARVVQPFDFIRLPVAALIGWLLFTELPDLWTWLGAAIIFGAAYYVLIDASRGRAR